MTIQRVWRLAAALKNIIAIGAGICQGLGLGNNSLAALITRGLAEITRLAVAMGGQPRTLSGLGWFRGSGTHVHRRTKPESERRHRTREGRKLAEIVSSMTMIAEGVETTSAAVELARKFNVDMPITAANGCRSSKACDRRAKPSAN